MLNGVPDFTLNFESKITVMVSIEKWLNPKCNSLSESWKYVYTFMKNQNIGEPAFLWKRTKSRSKQGFKGQ